MCIDLNVLAITLLVILILQIISATIIWGIWRWLDHKEERGKQTKLLPIGIGLILAAIILFTLHVALLVALAVFLIGGLIVVARYTYRREED